MGVSKFACDANRSVCTVKVESRDDLSLIPLPQLHRHRSNYPRSPLPMLVTPDSSPYPLGLNEYGAITLFSVVSGALYGEPASSHVKLRVVRHWRKILANAFSSVNDLDGILNEARIQ